MDPRKQCRGAAGRRIIQHRKWLFPQGKWREPEHPTGRRSWVGTYTPQMITLRPAVPSDAEAIAGLHAQSWRENYRGAYLDTFLDGDLLGERRAVWRERLDAHVCNQLVLVAVEGTSLAGFICVYAAHDPQWGSFIDNLHVARAFKRGGIGSALMSRAAAWLVPQCPNHGVYLLVLEMNASARRFYERLGGSSAEVSTMETHGGAVVRSCRYTWPRPAALIERA